MKRTEAGLYHRPITTAEYEQAFRRHEYKLELIGGYIEFDDDAREALFRLLLVNVGTVMAVRMAPREAWLEALGIEAEKGK